MTRGRAAANGPSSDPSDEITPKYTPTGTAGHPAVVVEAFARLVARPGEQRGQRLDTNNHTGEWLSLGDLARSGQPFVVEYDPEVAVFDADRDDAPDAAMALCEEALALGYHPVVWASGRPGHRQVVIRVRDKNHQQVLVATGKALGMQARTRSRPPLSPHRLGLPVSLVYPDTVEDALKSLQRVCRTTSGTLTSRTWRLIRYGDPTADSGSEVIYRIVCGAVAVGFPADRLYGILLIPSNVGGDALRRRLAERGDKGAKRWFFREVWRRAEQFIRDNPPIEGPTEARVLLNEIRREITQHPWPTTPAGLRKGTGPKVRGTSLRQGLHGLIDLGLLAGRLDLTISERLLAHYAGFGSRDTATKTLRALQHLGWITLVWKGKGRRSSIYRILPNRARGNGPHEHSRREGV